MPAKPRLPTTHTLPPRSKTKKQNETDKYVEVCVDVGSNSTAAYVTGLVRGATKSLVLDLALLLEGRAPYELPEVLLGACRCARARRLRPWRRLLLWCGGYCVPLSLPCLPHRHSTHTKSLKKPCAF